MNSDADDNLLLTPGPLTTTKTVKEAMMRDFGSRDHGFIKVVQEVREGLLKIAGVSQATGYEAILMQGSGTFSLEAVISSAIRTGGKLLMVVNGAYGERILSIAQRHRIEFDAIRCDENALPDPREVEQRLASDPEISMVGLVHCETTSGILNPVREISQITKKHKRIFFLDSMSGFGGIPIDLSEIEIDYLVSSSNKCLQGVPGFGFVICNRETLLASEGSARTVSLDLLAQWQGLEKNGQFRFTPPTHAILAFRKAIEELIAEGGVTARARRYASNHQKLVTGMRSIGFVEYVPSERQSHIITSFQYPQNSSFDFDRFYELLAERTFTIYPGKVTNADCFRVGTIGDVHEHDIESFLTTVRDVLQIMSIQLETQEI